MFYYVQAHFFTQIQKAYAHIYKCTHHNAFVNELVILEVITAIAVKLGIVVRLGHITAWYGVLSDVA